MIEFFSKLFKKKSIDKPMAPPQEDTRMDVRFSPNRTRSQYTDKYSNNNNYIIDNLSAKQHNSGTTYKSQGSMPKQVGFNRVLDGLKKRQLEHDFRLERAADKYSPIQNIGSGAFGIVCEAVEITTKERVAIKKVAHASATPTLARRTLREIRVLSNIKHKNIVGHREIFRTNGPLGIDVYIVMDLMPTSLHHVIYGLDCLDEQTILSFLMQLLNGLQYLHQASIAHRDLKPSNLLVGENAELRIADFGMAKCYDKDSTKVNELDDHCFYMTQHVATLPYRAPELLFVLPEHSTAVDMWAVGCIFGEMVLKNEVFPGRNVQTQIQMLLAIFGRPPQHIIDEVRCDRTKKLIEDAHSFVDITWDQFLYNKNQHQTVFDNCQAVDFIKGLFEIDSKCRLTVDEALNHPYLRQAIPYESEIKGTAAFSAKWKMTDVEKMNHTQLIEALQKDALSATYKEIHSGKSTGSSSSDMSTECSGDYQSQDEEDGIPLQISICSPDSY